MPTMKHCFLASLAACLLSMPAMATEYLSFNAGSYNALRNNQQAAQFGAEYRFNQWQYGIRPVVGGFFTTDSAAYGYAGLNWDIALIPNRLYLVPNFAAGAYSEGDGKRLGGVIEFRSGIEIAYQFENAHQLGVTLNHLSNAGIYDHNPGEESILLIYSLPVGNWLGR